MSDLVALAKWSRDRLAGKSADQISVLDRLNNGQHLIMDEDGYMSFQPSRDELFCDPLEIAALENLGYIKWVDSAGYSITRTGRRAAHTNGNRTEGE